MEYSFYDFLKLIGSLGLFLYGQTVIQIQTHLLMLTLSLRQTVILTLMHSLKRIRNLRLIVMLKLIHLLMLTRKLKQTVILKLIHLLMLTRSLKQTVILRLIHLLTLILTLCKEENTRWLKNECRYTYPGRHNAVSGLRLRMAFASSCAAFSASSLITLQSCGFRYTRSVRSGKG